MTEFHKALGAFMNDYINDHGITRLGATTDMMKVMCALLEADTAMLIVEKGGKMFSIVEGNRTALEPRRLRVTLESMRGCLQEIIDHTDSSPEESMTSNRAYVRDDVGGGFTRDDSILPGQS